jgi:hypothetical protein
MAGCGEEAGVLGVRHRQPGEEHVPHTHAMGRALIQPARVITHDELTAGHELQIGQQRGGQVAHRFTRQGTEQ